MTLFPSNFGMSKVGDDSGDGGGDEIGKPEKAVVFDDEIGENGVENEIKKGDTNANKKVASCVTAGFDIIGIVFGFHGIIIAYGQNANFLV